MDKHRIQDNLNDIEGLIKAGKLSTALKDLKKLRGQPPSFELLRYAQLCRRAGSPAMGLQVLNRIVRPSGHSKAQGTPEEKVEYAASLIRLGAVKEGLGILDKLENLAPEAILIQAFAHISKWDYDKSIPLLKKYIQSPSLSRYQRLVGKINLLAAHIYEHDEAAGPLLEQLHKEAAKDKHSFAYRTIILYEVQQQIVHRSYKAAHRALKEASLSIEQEGSNYENLFLRKWEAVLALLEFPKAKNLELLQQVKKEAERLQIWETVRDCDLWEVIALKDPQKFAHLYYGTPFAHYRKKLVESYEGSVKLEDAYCLSLGKPKKDSPCIDWLKPGTSTNPKFPRGGVLQNALLVLLSDFYRPSRLLHFFSELYPGEYYCSDSSPLRVHATLRRVRRALSGQKIPIEVVELNQQYRLESRAGCQIWVPQHRETLDEYSHLFGKMQKEFKQRKFSVVEASKCLGLPNWTIRRILQKAGQRELIHKTAKGSATRYRFKTEALKKAA